jgi:ATP-binding cassette, subfamily B, bacterial
MLASRVLERPRVALRSLLKAPAFAGTVAILRLLPQVDAGRTALLSAATLLSAALPIVLSVCLGLLAGSVPASVAQGPGSSAARYTLTLFLLICLLTVVVRVLAPIQSALAAVFARRIDRSLQERVIAAVARPAGVAHLEDPETLDLVKNAQGVGAEGHKPGEAVNALATLLPSWLQALGAACVLLTFNPALGLVWIVLWPVVLAFLMREYVRVGQTAYNSAAVVRRSRYFLDLALKPPEAKELRTWGMLDWIIGRYEATWLEAMLPVWRIRDPSRPAIWLTVCLVVAMNLAAYGLLVYAALRGDLTLAALVVYARATQDASSFRAFDDPNAHLAYAAVALPSLFALERRLAPVAATGSRTLLPPDAPRHRCRFENVTFRYPNQETDVLAGMTLEIPVGRSLAIVGANGAGKTTLIKLLCGLYEPTRGRITVDGVDLRQVDPAEWQQRLAAIFQDFVQYDLTVRQNVALGAPDHAGDFPGLQAAAERAGALELIESLPRGWDTVLSRRYTDGVDLSGGQWQRIALARALFAAASVARVLILDEPTAALDVRAEAALYDRFLEITAGLTTLLISHRFSTVRRADHIVVLENGRISEQGTHDSLVAAGGQYATMFALQAARFADDVPAADAQVSDTVVARQ